eukprot:1090587-Karenia_brevis.AAC.1
MYEQDLPRPNLYVCVYGSSDQIVKVPKQFVEKYEKHANQKIAEEFKKVYEKAKQVGIDAPESRNDEGQAL